MPDKATAQRAAETRAIRHEVADAGDEKILRIVALLDRSSAPAGAQAILDPLRPRLAALRPSRPLRFERLLFMPFGSLVVPALAWRPDKPAIPRGTLMSFGQTVRAGLNAISADIDRIIQDKTTHDTAAVMEAGEILWSRAADYLADTPDPVGWDATGLPATVYPGLARAIASVLRRALDLRGMVRDAAIGATGPNEAALRRLFEGIAKESAVGCGMLVTLLLEELPHAATHLRLLLAAGSGTPEWAILRQSMDRGVDDLLTQMEHPAGFDDEIRNAPLHEIGQEVARISALLRDIEAEPDTAKHRPRLYAIRTKLDALCRQRFDAGLTDRLVAPLSSPTRAVDGSTQSGMETSVRDLRVLETAARDIGSASHYRAQLEKATATVSAAVAAGILTPMRQVRLVELLAGPEAADALYRSFRTA